MSQKVAWLILNTVMLSFETSMLSLEAARLGCKKPKYCRISLKASKTSQKISRLILNEFSYVKP